MDATRNLEIKRSNSTLRGPQGLSTHPLGLLNKLSQPADNSSFHFVWVYSQF